MVVTEISDTVEEQRDELSVEVQGLFEELNRPPVACSVPWKKDIPSGYDLAGVYDGCPAVVYGSPVIEDTEESVYNA